MGDEASMSSTCEREQMIVVLLWLLVCETMSLAIAIHSLFFFDLHMPLHRRQHSFTEWMTSRPI